MNYDQAINKFDRWKHKLRHHECWEPDDEDFYEFLKRFVHLLKELKFSLYTTIDDNEVIKMDKEKLAEKPPLMTCKECGEEHIMLATRVEISIRSASTAIEIVADDVCITCLLKAIQGG